jgi:hypothetical protein
MVSFPTETTELCGPAWPGSAAWPLLPIVPEGTAQTFPSLAAAIGATGLTDSLPPWGATSLGIAAEDFAGPSLRSETIDPHNQVASCPLASLSGPPATGSSHRGDDLIAPSSGRQTSQALGNLADLAGNTLAAARNIGTLAGLQNFSDWVGSTDTNDYYRFSLAQASSFNLSLTGLSADADVQLLSGTGGFIASSVNGSTTAETITRSLAAGSYVVRVYPYRGNTSYNLSLFATPPDNAGNTLTTARAIGTLTSSQSFSDWVGDSDSNDYYSFSLAQAGNFSLSLTGLSADADVQLLSSNGSVLNSSVKGGSTAESISQFLNAGSYAVRVYRYSGNTTYTLTLAATPPDNAGNTLATSRAIGTLSSSQTFNDWVGDSDSNDYYSFSLAQSSDFSLTLNGLSADADVELLSINGSVLNSSVNGGSATESISRFLDAGSYAVRVYPYSGYTPYTLTLAATPTDNAGNTLTAARAIGTLSSSQSFNDRVSSTDGNDYYSFTLAEASNFSLTLNGLSDNADVELLNSDGSVLASSSNGGSSAETISSSLAIGSYFVRVYPFSGSTNYSLTLSATPSTTWFSTYLMDAGLISLGNSLGLDGHLSRNDIISLLRDAKDDNQIDANELTDLRTILNNATIFNMSDSTKNLASKIVNGDPANNRAGFGNLYAGGSAILMENLIGKWFMGLDRPKLTSSSYSYNYASGSLFQYGVAAGDIIQNDLGDCYYLATLASLAQEKPNIIQDMFEANSDGTFTVRFFNNGVADYVTVDRYLPTGSNGLAVYAGWGGATATSISNELWVALAEKAYAQLAESGWSRTYAGTQVNAYASIEGGWMAPVIRQLMGVSASSSSVTSMTQTQLINLVNSNQVLTAGFVYGAGFGVVNGHAYTVTSYNATAGTFHLRNPWGSSHADVTWQQLLSLKAILEWSTPSEISNSQPS